MKLALLFSGLASVWSLLALLFSGPVEVGLEGPCFSAGLSPGGIPCVSLPKMAGSCGDCAPSSPRCLWGVADAFPDSDVVDRSPLVSCGSSSERADSLAADDAFDAVVDLLILIADDAAVDDAAAVVFVRGRLTACGRLRIVAVVVLGDGFTELQWITADGSLVAVVAPPAAVGPGAADAAAPPWLFVPLWF